MTGMSTVRLSRTQDTPLSVVCECAACGEHIALGAGVLRYFGPEEQVATNNHGGDHYPVHILCPRDVRAPSEEIRSESISGHTISIRWSKQPYSKFPITLWVDGSPTRRTWKNAYEAISKIRKEME